ncbi:hypothetical protein PS943_04370 [Pseudomonas fluorescens]|uniref:MoaF C-terminal domain-containing protein n=1 Tax=Pseudomonas fluorescens TaxID=294 RepID=A0A5E7WLJ2_PSEFL|nr:hypothetical protein PS943_04370 [Pseudomonas fluorescens]
MVGKRIFYRYSDIETYEHIYLNLGSFTWHCLRGGEVGLADTDRCMTWKVAENLYIFFWTEKVMNVKAVLLIDLQERSIGRMFGWDDTLKSTLVLPFNSRLSVMPGTSQKAKRRGCEAASSTSRRLQALKFILGASARQHSSQLIR